MKPPERLTHRVPWASFRSSVSRAASRALLCGPLLILGGCSGGKAASAPPPPTVEVATVIQRDTPIYSDWVATLDGYVNAEIQPRVSGYIIKQNYKEGAVGTAKATCSLRSIRGR